MKTVQDITAPAPRAELTLSYTPEERGVLASLDLEKIPRHIACIMDGNGRWAKRRLRERIFGHTTARQTVRQVVETCRDLGVSCLTLYAFSSENWRRPAAEVAALMRLLAMALREEREELHRNGIRLRLLGDPGPLPASVKEEIRASEELMAGNDRMVLNLAINYGGRQDIVRAARLLAEHAAAGTLRPQDIDEAAFAGALSTRHDPDPELLIRTAGEYRVSNFLLWEIAYTEILISDRLWPEFTRFDLLEAIRNFQSRDRRFGGL